MAIKSRFAVTKKYNFMKNNLSRNTAFTLTELSIVIIIIGIVIAGIVSSKDIIAAAKLRSARALTESSAVRSIEDLAVWYETTLPESFDDDVDFTSQTDNVVSVWHDINPEQSVSGRGDAVQTVQADKPSLANDAINGLPALKFIGSTHHLLNQKILLKKNVSIFAVATIATNPDERSVIISGYDDYYFFFGFSAVNNQFSTFYGDGSSWSNQWTFGADSRLKRGKPYIISSTLETAGTGHLNGVNVGTLSQSKGKSGSFGHIIGKARRITDTNPWNGYIGEIIIFNKKLTSDERRSVETYLGKKWGIKVAGEN